MAQRSLFFNDTETEPKVYFAEDEARYNYLMMAGHGIAKQGDYEPYEIKPKQNMVITVGAGACFINGYLHEIYDIPEDLELDAADPTRDRIDRIILQFINTPTEREIHLKVLKGIPSDLPIAPSIIRTEDIYQLSLGRILVEAGKSFIEPHQIIDEKNNPLVSGYSPLHNILRGIDVTETGIVTTKNNCYLEARNDSEWTLTPNVYKKLMFGENILINSNVQYNTEQSEINIDVSGVYIFRILISTIASSTRTGDNIQILAYKNGEEDRLITQHVVTSTSDNIAIATGFMDFNAGDKASFYTYARVAASALTFGRAHLTWMKVA